MTINQLAARAQDPALSTTHVALIISLLSLVILALGLIGALFFVRNMRRARRQDEADQLPQYNDVPSRRSHLTITTDRKSVLVYAEKEALMTHCPTSPVPEIRITFPDEVDDAGKRQSGRVVVVRVGEHSVGLEPVGEDALPPYQRDAHDRFDSLDLDRIGGLKEKNDNEYA